MLDWVYLHEKPLPLEVNQVARILLLNECLTDVEQVLNEFFTKAEHGWVSVRAMAEIAEYNDKQEKASRAGKASAEARKNKIKQQLMNDEQAFNERSTTVQPNKKQETLNNKHIKDITPRALLEAENIPQNLIDDWLKIRKAKRAVLTETVISATKREAEKASITFLQAVQHCCENSWAGFKAEYLNNKRNSFSDSREHGRQVAARSIFKPVKQDQLQEIPSDIYQRYVCIEPCKESNNWVAKWKDNEPDKYHWEQGVMRWHLRPDDWHKTWPELITHPCSYLFAKNHPNRIGQPKFSDWVESWIHKDNAKEISDSLPHELSKECRRVAEDLLLPDDWQSIWPELAEAA